MGYYRSLLNDKEKETFDLLERGMLNVRARIRMPRWTFHYIQMATIALQMDQPELFYVDFSSITYEQSRFMTVCNVAYDDTDAGVKARKAYMEQLADRITRPLKGKSELQIELAVHDYLVKNVRSGAMRGDERASTAEGALVDGMAWGTGMARAFVYLAGRAGVPAMIVSGRYKDQPDAHHAWNIVNLSGNCHHVDVMGEQMFGGCPTRTCFNLSDQQAQRRLEPFLIYPLPACSTSASPIPYARRPAELLDALRTGANRGARMIQVSTAHHFKDTAEIESLLQRRISQQDVSWYNRIDRVLHEPEWDVISFSMK
ncbi:MAG: transglutaminase-like domain-containing protein [Clostridia bacterium]|nr:transglutaminase-like domain-containing protein [Clostridia bacterium]